jgi:hypothetical protein
MKRVLVLLSLVCALALASACHYDVNLSVKAKAELTYANGDVIRIDPVLFEGFHHNRLTDNDLEDIFIDLTQHVSPDFTTAVLQLEIFDEIGGKPLRDETYGVVYNSRTGHYDFADMSVNY